MEPIDEDKLAEMIPLEDVKGNNPPSLKSYFDEASALLCFQVVNDEEKGSILLQQKGAFDWWNRLNPKVTVGYKKVGGMEAEPRVQRLSLACESMVSLRQALRDLRELRIKGIMVRRAVKEEAEKVNSWELASAIVVLQTSLNKLRVCDKYVR